MSQVMVGVDNYSFHRLLGEVREGELKPDGPRWSWEQTVKAAVRAGAEVIALETCFMTRAGFRDAPRTRGDIAVMLSWGHPYGLEYGSSPSAEEDARAWLSLAAELGHTRMRIVIAHPKLRGPGDGWDQVRQSVPALTRLAGEAQQAGVRLGIENHADVTAEQLAWVLGEVGSPALGVCFDTANAVRVGDDPVDAATALAPWVIAAHVKDIAAAPWHHASGPTSVPLGDGTIAVADVVAAIAHATDDCWFLVELAHLGPGQADEVAMVAHDLDWLRQHLQGGR